MTNPGVLILRAPGTNCDHDTAFAFERAGATTERIHINRLLETPDLMEKFQILCIPGGFSFGDDVAAGRILANQMRSRLSDALRSFRDAGKLILGICNGFQVLIRSGFLLEDDVDGAAATLTWNESGRYNDSWVRLGVHRGEHVDAPVEKCVFLRGIERMELPVAHAEGRFVARDTATLDRLEAAGQLCLRYLQKDGSFSPETLPYPENPNGSQRNVAGVCDTTGRVFG
ncbi:MAG: phosphoribosylformylglycinamidine synthase subunit PurQ, partial [Planctomycetia bacterium]|nr:phosphoribosylformylglycinamidine synthase subunit PurQ [Planctomycetia bacterium]